jgi:hypothetical protein
VAWLPADTIFGEQDKLDKAFGVAACTDAVEPVPKADPACTLEFAGGAFPPKTLAVAASPL